MRDGRPGEIHDLQFLSGALRRLAHGIRHGIGLARAHADRAPLVADHHRHAEAKAATTLDDLRHAGDLNHPFFKSVLASGLLLARISSLPFTTPPGLELEATLTGGVGQRLDASDVLESATIKHDHFDALALGSFRHDLTNRAWPARTSSVP